MAITHIASVGYGFYDSTTINFPSGTNVGDLAIFTIGSNYLPFAPPSLPYDWKYLFRDHFMHSDVKLIGTSTTPYASRDSSGLTILYCYVTAATLSASMTMSAGTTDEIVEACATLSIFRGCSVDLAYAVEFQGESLTMSFKPLGGFEIGDWVLAATFHGDYDVNVPAPSGYTQFIQRSETTLGNGNVTISGKQMSSVTETPPSITNNSGDAGSDSWVTITLRLINQTNVRPEEKYGLQISNSSNDVIVDGQYPNMVVLASGTANCTSRQTQVNLPLKSRLSGGFFLVKLPSSSNIWVGTSHIFKPRDGGSWFVLIYTSSYSVSIPWIYVGVPDTATTGYGLQVFGADRYPIFDSNQRQLKTFKSSLIQDISGYPYSFSLTTPTSYVQIYQQIRTSSVINNQNYFCLTPSYWQDALSSSSVPCPTSTGNSCYRRHVVMRNYGLASTQVQWTNMFEACSTQSGSTSNTSSASTEGLCILEVEY